MRWLRRFLGDDLALQKAIEAQTSTIAALTDRVDERIRIQLTKLECASASLDKALVTQKAGIDQFGASVKESVLSQENSLSNFAKRLESGLECQVKGLANVAHSISEIKALPLPVQTFPLIEDPRWENEKQYASQLAESMFGSLDKHFIEILATAENDVRWHMENFIKEINHATNAHGDDRQKAIRRSLDSLLTCSPKKIISAYQGHALEVGWSYIYTFNRIVDGFAEWYPRCRSGIYSSRLKYSDVIQVTEEVLTTLRACSTILEDLQRRYDLLEALQASIQADFDDPACERIWKAFGNAMTDAYKHFGDAEDEGFLKTTLKRVVAIGSTPVTFAGSVMAATSAQFNEQMSREQRLMVFLKTALMFCEAWGEWRVASKRIVAPNLRILFALKRDYVRNQVLCMCDLVNYNNYQMDGLRGKLLALTTRPNVIASWRKHCGSYGERSCTLNNDGTFIITNEPAAEWSKGQWAWTDDVIVFNYVNGQSTRHAFHGPDMFSELHNDKVWYERIT